MIGLSLGGESEKAVLTPPSLWSIMETACKLGLLQESCVSFFCHCCDQSPLLTLLSGLALISHVLNCITWACDSSRTGGVKYIYIYQWSSCSFSSGPLNCQKLLYTLVVDVLHRYIITTILLMLYYIHILLLLYY